MNKIKLFIYGDSPTAHTGFGTVTRNIAIRLLKTEKYEIHCLGINFKGDPDPLLGTKDLYIYPTIGDPRGIDRLLPLLNKVQPDILFVVNDYDAGGFIPNIVMQYKNTNNKSLPVCWHFPVDGAPVYGEYAEFMSRYIDKPVVISEFGQEQFKKAIPEFEIDQIYHGINMKDFFPIKDKEEIARIKKQLGNKFIVLMVGTNQLRKAYPQAIEAFSEFAKDKKDVLLFLHTQRKTGWGWNLDKIVRLFDIGNKVAFTDGIQGFHGVDIKVLNLIYNSADVFLHTSVGEGFGLPVAEALTVGKPIIYHNVTSTPEVVGDSGYPIDSDYDIIFPNNDRELIRPLPSVKQITEALEDLYSNPDKREELSKKARERAIAKHESGDFNWDNVASYFDTQFMELTNSGDVETLTLDEIL